MRFYIHHSSVAVAVDERLFLAVIWDALSVMVFAVVESRCREGKIRVNVWTIRGTKKLQ